MDVRAPLCVLGGVLLAIGAERGLNMALIGRPLDSFIVRALVFQLATAAGLVCLILAALLGRRR